MPLEQKTREIMFVKFREREKTVLLINYKRLLSRKIGIVLNRCRGFWLAIVDDSIKTSFLIDEIKKAEKAAFSNSRCGNSMRNAIQAGKRKTLKKNVCFLRVFVYVVIPRYTAKNLISPRKTRDAV